VIQVLRRDAAKARGIRIIRPAQLLHARARNDDTTDEVKCPTELEEWLQIPFEHLDREQGVSRVIRTSSLREHGARDEAKAGSRLDASLLVNLATGRWLADQTAEVDVVEDKPELIREVEPTPFGGVLSLPWLDLWKPEGTSTRRTLPCSRSNGASVLLQMSLACV